MESLMSKKMRLNVPSICDIVFRIQRITCFHKKDLRLLYSKCMAIIM